MISSAFLAWLTWDPSREIVVLPVIGLSLTWYGLLFAMGFFLGFHIFVSMFKRYLIRKTQFVSGDVDWKAFTKLRSEELKSIQPGSIESCNAFLQREGGTITKRLYLERKYPKIFLPLSLRAKDFAERLMLYVIVATIIGARLGHILFYEDLFYYFAHPLLILKTWEGGLASHGAVVAILIAVGIFYRKNCKKYPDFSWYRLLDGIGIPTLLAGSLIRVGNFFNQEILGTPSSLPWAIIFAHPADGSAAVPRHPAQLYEALFYFGLFLFLYSLWKKYADYWEPGRFAGITLVGSFLFRFLIEFVKSGQSLWFDRPDSLFLMGQWLSIPLLVIGGFLLLRKRRVPSLSS